MKIYLKNRAAHLTTANTNYSLVWAVGLGIETILPTKQKSYIYMVWTCI